MTEPGSARQIAACSIRLSPGSQRTVNAGPATRGTGVQSGRIPMSITWSRPRTSARVVGGISAKALMTADPIGAPALSLPGCGPPDERHAGRLGRLDAQLGVLEDQTSGRVGAEPAGRGQVGL